MRAFWLFFTYDLWESRRIASVIQKLLILYYMKQIDLDVAVSLFSNRSQKTSKCGKVDQRKQIELLFFNRV